MFLIILQQILALQEFSTLFGGPDSQNKGTRNPSKNIRNCVKGACEIYAGRNLQ